MSEIAMNNEYNCIYCGEMRVSAQHVCAKQPPHVRALASTTPQPLAPAEQQGDNPFAKFDDWYKTLEPFAFSESPEAMMRRAFVAGVAYRVSAQELQGDALDYERGVLDEHKSHLDFENELYATLVDPVAEGPIKEAEMRKQLLESARWYRQHAYDLETQLNNARAAEQRATRAALEAAVKICWANHWLGKDNRVSAREIEALSAPARTPSEEER